jgi:hypothetical protein
MGKASRRRREHRADQGTSTLYRVTSPAVIAEGEKVLRAYTEARDLRATDPQVLDGWDATISAESAALEALGTLVDRRGPSADLLFADLLEDQALSRLTPVMPRLLRFLRAGLAEQAPVLRLDHDTPSLALTLLLAAHALVQAADAPADSPQAEAVLNHCLARLARDTLNDRLPPGDLGVGLSKKQRARASVEQIARALVSHAQRPPAPSAPGSSPTGDHTRVIELDGGQSVGSGPEVTVSDDRGRAAPRMQGARRGW